MTRAARLLAIGWFGERNLGDEAMLEGLLALARRALGPLEATVLSADPEATATRYGVRAIRQPPPERAGFRNVELTRATLAADLVTMGGGDLVRDPGVGLAPALYWLRRLRVPLALRRPTALVGVSVGDLARPEVVAEVRAVLPRLGLVAGRDLTSVQRLAELGARAPLRIGDLGFEALAPVSVAPSVDGRPRIGVAVRELVGRGRGAPPESGERLLGELAGALDLVVERLAATVALIPFRTRRRAGPDDDARVGEELAARARRGASWIRHERPEDAAAFGRLAASLDVVVGIRLHAVVLGAAAGRPVLGVAYDPKVPGVLHDLGLDRQVLPLDASAAEIAEAIELTLGDPDAPVAVARGVADVRRRTAELETPLAALAGRRGRS